MPGGMVVLCGYSMVKVQLNAKFYLRLYSFACLIGLLYGIIFERT